ncbi:fatty acyl-CoA reductase wat-like isoform X2 [Anopheles albimanus]|uniref:fatty acyl-CoA reductase wat-like isoform X2 n=1 Tax=Anopheles albimanus TaxID=7167 RepID=UPI00163F046C|nr:fatty acyl-CoA reductase wat-like isoform X2 [Anopheles albimanus]
MASHSPPNRVLNFYRNSTILLTGGTGFLGKVLLEKILRCLDVRKVFLLIRTKDNLKPAERLDRLLKDAIFDRLRADPDHSKRLLERLEAVEFCLGGDSERLGIEHGTEERLLRETEIVFNVLASVKFNESIRNAIATNVGGTRKVLLLAKRMVRLKTVVHVSTLYSNCDRPTIEERVYRDVPFGPSTVLELSRLLSEEEMSCLQHCLVGRLPNTYTFSKRCAEALIAQDFSELPVGIFRPPIVLSTYREPLAGWTDNLNGPSGLCLWTVKGVIRVIHGDAGKKANLVPVDYCVNALLVAGYDVAERASQVPIDESCEPDQLTSPVVFNYVYAAANITWGRYMDRASLGFDRLLHRVWWPHSYGIVANRMLYRLAALCCHTLPAHLLDLGRRVCGRQPVFAKMMSKTGRFLEMMSYFGLREWHTANDNVVRLRSLLSPAEASVLEFDLATVDWDEYFRHYIPGLQRYVVGGKPGDKSKAMPRWSNGSWNRRIHFWCRLLYKACWIFVCLRFATRLCQTYLLRRLFAILIC